VSGVTPRTIAGYLFVANKDGTWHLSCEETGELLVIFESSDDALKFAQALMADDEPWRVVIRGVG